MTEAAQQIADELGATQRATEAALDASDLDGARAAAQQHHNALTTGFAYLRDVLGLELDWGSVAGTTAARGGAETEGGGSKDPPPSFDGPQD